MMPAVTSDWKPSRAVIFSVRLRARSCAASSSLRVNETPFDRGLPFFVVLFIFSGLFVKPGRRIQCDLLSLASQLGTERRLRPFLLSQFHLFPSRLCPPQLPHFSFRIWAFH